jgi:flagellar export protein FliJ
MPRFVFTLQALLDQRVHAERRAQHAVAALERQRLDLEARVSARQGEIRAFKAELRSLLGGQEAGVDLRTVRVQAAASLHAHAQTQRLALGLAGVYQRLEGARRALREAATRRRAVELLRERRYAAWKREIDRRESSELDEIGTMKAARASMNGGDE